VDAAATKHLARRRSHFYDCAKASGNRSPATWQASESTESRQTGGEARPELKNAMLAEKYMLLLETIRSLAERSPAYADGAPRVISTSPHVPVQLPGAGRK
jgi:hypothetical protein